MPSKEASKTERGVRLLSIGTATLNSSWLQLICSSFRWRGNSGFITAPYVEGNLVQNTKLRDLPRPYKIFDLAGGTSTGGYVLSFVFEHLIIFSFRLIVIRDNALPAKDVKLFMPYARLAKHKVVCFTSSSFITSCPHLYSQLCLCDACRESEFSIPFPFLRFLPRPTVALLSKQLEQPLLRLLSSKPSNSENQSGRGTSTVVSVVTIPLNM